MSTKSSVFVSGQILAHFPITTQLHILDCFIEEGAKVFYRLALLIAPQRFVPDFCASQSDSTAFLRRAFGLRLSRNDIDDVENEQKHKKIPPAPLMKPIPAWPDLGKLADVPSIFTTQQWICLWSWLPSTMQHAQPQVCFDTAKDGFSLGALTRAVVGVKPVLLIVKDTSNAVFGALLPGGINSGIRVDPSAFLFSFATSEPRSWNTCGEHVPIICNLKSDSLDLVVQ